MTIPSSSTGASRTSGPCRRIVESVPENVGASLMMRIQTTFRLFGYPGLAIICFVAAAGGGFWLVINIFIQDYRSRKKITR